MSEKWYSVAVLLRCVRCNIAENKPMILPDLSRTLSVYTDVPRVMREVPDATPLGLRQQNTVLDWLFYDVGRLTEAERHALVQETHHEGSVIVVWPAGADRAIGFRKHDDYAGLCSAPGRMLEHFAIAGVGSTDLGAVAFARTLADHVGEPVGAIVAGYGVADLLDEALGGWLVFGGANRLLRWTRTVEDAAQSLADAMRTSRAGPAPRSGERSRAAPDQDDSKTLLRLLSDPDRRVRWLAGHSKGCLSIAYALEALLRAGDEQAIARARTARITTAGAVVQLPRGFDNAGQYLGMLDGFGGVNSRIGVDFHPWPGAWHHLNTDLPMHMDFAEVLRRESRHDETAPDPVA